jgi:hypothetical protein
VNKFSLPGIPGTADDESAPDIDLIERPPLSVWHKRSPEANWRVMSQEPHLRRTQTISEHSSLKSGGGFVVSSMDGAPGTRDNKGMKGE